MEAQCTSNSYSGPTQQESPVTHVHKNADVNLLFEEIQLFTKKFNYLQNLLGAIAVCLRT